MKAFSRGALSGPRRAVGLSLIAGLLFAGCDPSFAVVASNLSGEDMLVARVGSDESGEPILDVVAMPAGSDVRLRSLRVDSWPEEVVILTPSCDVLARQTLGEAFEDGGEVMIRSRGDIEFRPGRSTGGDALPIEGIMRATRAFGSRWPVLSR